MDNKSHDLVPSGEFDNTTIVRAKENNKCNGNTIIGCESVYVNQHPQYDLELSTKQYTDTLFDESSIVRNNKQKPMFSLNTDPTKQFDDYEVDMFHPNLLLVKL